MTRCIYTVYSWKFWRAAAIFIYDFTDVDLVYFQYYFQNYV